MSLAREEGGVVTPGSVNGYRVELDGDVQVRQVALPTVKAVPRTELSGC